MVKTSGERAFYYEYGRALAYWASLEAALCDWFHFTTKMPPDMAAKVFYSARNFNGRSEMLEAAIAVSELTEDQEAFIKAATARALAYNSFRNRIAHGLTVRTLRRNLISKETSVEWSLARGDTFFDPVKNPQVTVSQLKAARSNFGKLAAIIVDAFVHCEYCAFPEMPGRPPSECLA